MKKILFPTDFSLQAHQALEYIVAYLEDQGAPCLLVLLNTYYPQSKSTTADEIIRAHDQAIQRSREGLRKELEFLRRSLLKGTDTPLSCETVSHLGNLENVMARLAEQMHVHGIVMAGSGIDPSGKLKTLACPVFVIPPEARYPEKKNIEQFKLK